MYVTPVCPPGTWLPVPLPSSLPSSSPVSELWTQLPGSSPGSREEDVGTCHVEMKQIPREKEQHLQSQTQETIITSFQVLGDLGFHPSSEERWEEQGGCIWPVSSTSPVHSRQWGQDGNCEFDFQKPQPQGCRRQRFLVGQTKKHLCHFCCA